MKVLIVGGSGFVGSHVCRVLVDEGHTVTVAGLSLRERVPGTRWLPCDRRDPRLFEDRLQHEEADAVVDLIAYRDDETRRMVRLFRGRTDRFVHLSTLSVFAAAHDPEVTEENAVRGGPPDSYGGSKSRCEAVLEDAFHEEGFPAVILRSAPLMGPGDPVSREHYFLKRLLAGRPIFVPGAPGAHLTVLYVEDLARAVLEALRRPQAVGRDYNLAQAERITLEEHIDSIARVCGARPAMVSSQGDAGHSRNPFAFPYGPLESSAWVVTARARHELAFEPTAYPVALERTVSWLRVRRSWPAWPGNGSMQCRLAGTHEWLEDENEYRRDGGGVAASTPDDDLSPDQILQALCTGDEPATTVVPRTVWREMLADTTRTARTARSPGAVVAVPDELCGLLGGVSRTQAGDGRLAAVFEPMEGDALTYRLFTEWGARRAKGYRFSNAPPLVQCLAFAAFDWSREIPAGTRLLVTVADAASEDAIHRWRDAWSEEGRWRIPSLRRLARVFLAGSDMLSRQHGQCCLTFDVVRLLVRGVAVEGDGPFDLEFSGDGHRLFPPLETGPRQDGGSTRPSFHVIRIDRRFFVVRFSPAAVLEVTAAVAALLEVRTACGDDRSAITPALAAALQLDTRRAAALVDGGRELLAKAGLTAARVAPV